MNGFVDIISSQLNVNPNDIFKKDKRKNIVNARHILYYLSKKRNISIVEIENFMNENAYKIEHSSIIYGIGKVDSRYRSDRDYRFILKKIMDQCSII